METLILMTGTYRLDNLLKIAKSINKYYDEYISKFNIIWLITIDQTHAIGNIENTIEYLNSTNIHYNISYVNINKDKVYGGDLFNDTLKQYVLENNINPWVYVLDDDNLLHPSLFNTFNICLNNSFYGNKEIILLTLKWDDTYIREINEDINNLIIDVHVSNMDVTKHSAYVPILSNNIKEKIYKLILEELQNE